MKGKIFLDLKIFDEAIKMYNIVIQFDPSNGDAFYNKGIIISNTIGKALSELKMFDNAILMYDEAIKINKNDTESYYNKGMISNKRAHALL